MRYWLPEGLKSGLRLGLGLLVLALIDFLVQGPSAAQGGAEGSTVSSQHEQSQTRRLCSHGLCMAAMSTFHFAGVQLYTSGRAVGGSHIDCGISPRVCWRDRVAVHSAASGKHIWRSDAGGSLSGMPACLYYLQSCRPQAWYLCFQDGLPADWLLEYAQRWD
jgi:hypothetical protein